MISRRALFAVPSLVFLRRFAPDALAQSTPAAAPHAGFPAQHQDLVREVVGAAHGNIARLRELVGRQQTLAEANYDWGFGDWESCLGGASHIGHRECAEYLLANGAHPTIFSAAMLGQLDVVKAYLTTGPGVQRIRGPHDITLLRHAVAGGAPAKPVVDYLNSVAGADEQLPRQPITPEEMQKLTGNYREAGREPVAIAVTNNNLTFAMAGRSRALRHLGSLEFAPAGAANVRIVFAEAAGVMSLTVRDPDVVLQAMKQ
jgi:hypothetical protein